MGLGLHVRKEEENHRYISYCKSQYHTDVTGLFHGQPLFNPQLSSHVFQIVAIWHLLQKGECFWVVWSETSYPLEKKIHIWLAMSSTNCEYICLCVCAWVCAFTFLPKERIYNLEIMWLNIFFHSNFLEVSEWEIIIYRMQCPKPQTSL